MWLDKLIVGGTLVVSLMSSSTTSAQTSSLYRFRPGTGPHIASADDPTIAPGAQSMFYPDVLAASGRAAQAAGTWQSVWGRLQIGTGDYDWRGESAFSFLAENELKPDAVNRTDIVELSPQAQMVGWILDATTLSRARLGDLLGVRRQTIHAWERNGKVSSSHLKKLLALQDVLRRARRLHGSPESLSAWLSGFPGESSETPADLLRRGMFDQARVLAVITTSPGLRPQPRWDSSWQAKGEELDEGSLDREPRLPSAFKGKWIE
jgi:hypothetical protein